MCVHRWIYDVWTKRRGQKSQKRVCISFVFFSLSLSRKLNVVWGILTYCLFFGHFKAIEIPLRWWSLTHQSRDAFQFSWWFFLHLSCPITAAGCCIRSELIVMKHSVSWNWQLYGFMFGCYFNSSPKFRSFSH